MLIEFFCKRNEELTRILERIVDIGLRGGWAELQDTPLQIPRIELAHHLRSSLSNSPVQNPSLEPASLQDAQSTGDVDTESRSSS